VKRPVSAVVLLLLLAGCNMTAETPAHVSDSFAEVFAGLYVSQQAALGRTDLTRASLHTRGLCHRTGSSSQGPGEDWLCAVQYVDADTVGTQSFEMQVKPDGCWKADGPPTLQPATLADPVTGVSIVNQLAEFDGCLDTSWR
jgi:hypothetical protein